MASRWSRRTVEPERPQALVAAATDIPLTSQGWRTWRFGDQKWQQEAWRQYDICGELRYGTGWVGNALSRCRLYVADVDEHGDIGEETEDEDVRAVADAMFGGPAARAEAQRSIGINLSVAGEGFVVAQGKARADGGDQWSIASTSEVRRSGDKIVIDRSGGPTQVEKYTLQEGRDLLIRVWTPHPRRAELADSAVRAVLPILREIEQLTKYVFAQIDSRLAGAGMLFLPNNVEFPRGPDDPPGLAGFMAMLSRIMGAALADRESASSLVPAMATVPGEFLDKIKHLTFDTELTSKTRELREEAIRRLALGLDMPSEVLLGQGASNHWSAWLIEESTIKIHIVPPLVRVCDAYTRAYLAPALKRIRKDPRRFAYWYDTSSLTQRPDRQADGVVVYDKLLLSDDAMRQAGGWTDDQKPAEKERQQRLAVELLRANPQALANAALVALAGLPPEIAEAAAAAAAPPAVPGEVPAAVPPSEGGTVQVDGIPELPAESGAEAPALVASALDVGADMLVHRAMERAGARLLTRGARGAVPRETPAYLLHTQLRVLGREHADTLLAGAFEHAPMLAARCGVDAGRLTESLRVYCTELLLRATPHKPDALSMWLAMTARDDD